MKDKTFYKRIKYMNDDALESFVNGDIPNTSPTFKSECIIEINTRKIMGKYNPGKIYEGDHDCHRGNTYQDFNDA